MVSNSIHESPLMMSLDTLIGGLELAAEPWIHPLFLDNALNCNAFQISNTQLLTAAHCFLTTKNTSRFTVGNRPISSISIHPRFDPQSLVNDLAIIGLQPLVPLVDGLAVTFDSSAYYAQIGVEMTITSFYSTAGHSVQSSLGRQRVIGTPDCSTYFSKRGMSIDSSHVFCVGDYQDVTTTTTTTTPRTGTCRGDSGSPVYFVNESDASRVIVGLVSFGLPECGTGDPTVVALLSQGWSWIVDEVLRAGAVLPAIARDQARFGSNSGRAPMCNLVLLFLLLIYII